MCILNKLFEITKADGGYKISIGKHFFIVVCGYKIYCVYKRYANSIICIDNIRC